MPSPAPRKSNATDDGPSDVATPTGLSARRAAVNASSVEELEKPQDAV